MGAKEAKQAVEETTKILEYLNELKTNKSAMERDVKIVIVGPAGSGKSTLINNFLSAAKNERCIIVPTGKGDSGSGVSARILQYTIILEDGSNLPIKIIDSRGYQEDSVSTKSIKKVLGPGRLIGRPIPDADDNNTTNLEEDDTDVDATLKIFDPRTVSVVLYVFAPEWIEKFQQGKDVYKNQFKKVMETRQTVKSSGIPSFVVLTHIDELDDQVKANITNFSSEKITKLKDFMSNLLHEDFIIPTWNIPDADENIDVKQRCHILRLLKKAVKAGLEFHNQCKLMEPYVLQE